MVFRPLTKAIRRIDQSIQVDQLQGSYFLPVLHVPEVGVRQIGPAEVGVSQVSSI